MLILASTSDKVQVISSSTADLDVHASWLDVLVAAVTPGNKNTAVATATTTDVVAAPAVNTYRNVKLLSLRNKHATTSQDVTVQHVNATATVQLIKVTLAAGESLDFVEGAGWTYRDSLGRIFDTGVPAASDTVSGGMEIATQAEQETATDVVRAVSPGRQHFHPSATKCWGSFGVSANILASYNITSLTDTGTGDIAVTINVDFSSATYGIAMAVQRINSTAAEANGRCGTIKTASFAAGSFSMDCWDFTTTTQVIKDPTTWNFIACGDLA